MASTIIKTPPPIAEAYNRIEVRVLETANGSDAKIEVQTEATTETLERFTVDGEATFDISRVVSKGFGHTPPSVIARDDYGQAVAFVDSRLAQVYFVGDDSNKRGYVALNGVHQLDGQPLAPYAGLSVYPLSLSEFEGAEGQVRVFASGTSWRAEYDNSLVSVDPAQGESTENGEAVTITAISRTAGTLVRFVSEDDTLSQAVTVEVKAAEIEVQPREVAVTAGGAPAVLAVTCNTGWSVFPGQIPNPVEFVPSSGTGNGILRVFGAQAGSYTLLFNAVGSTAPPIAVNVLITA